MNFLICVRAIHLASAATVCGVASFRLVVARQVLRCPDEALAGLAVLRRELRWIMCGGLVATVVSGGAWLLLLAASLGGTLSTGVAWTLLSETRFGQVWTVRLILAVLIAAEAALPPPRSEHAERVRGLAMTVCAMGLLGSVALIGHAGATPGIVGDLHLASDVVHLVAAGAWLGGLHRPERSVVLGYHQIDGTFARCSRALDVLGSPANASCRRSPRCCAGSFP